MRTKEERIYRLLHGLSVYEAEDILSRDFGVSGDLDEWLDQCGDEEGTYVIGRCYRLPSGEYVRIYYLDTDMIVSDVRVTNR